MWLSNFLDNARKNSLLIKKSCFLLARGGLVGFVCFMYYRILHTCMLCRLIQVSLCCFRYAYIGMTCGRIFVESVHPKS